MAMILVSPPTFADEDFLIIAHRGASGYLPEHTLPAVAMAHSLGADYIEQDVVLTKDKHPIVLHDIHLDTVTDVATRFPNRKRNDGRYYAIDFGLAEIQQLRVNERIDLATGKPVFPGRFPRGKSRFTIPTLAEEIELIQGLNLSTNRNVGIYVEVKQPAWHRAAGFDISRIVIQRLKDFGYESNSDKAFLQCFDPHETQRWREQFQCKLKLVQLIGAGNSPFRYDAMCTDEGMKQMSKYADAIGPPISRLLSPETGRIEPSLIKLASKFDLKVHPYTLRYDQLPQKYHGTDKSLLQKDLKRNGAAGVFTDFPKNQIKNTK